MYIDGQEKRKLCTDVLMYTVHKIKYYIHVIEMFKIKAPLAVFNIEFLM